MMLSKTHQLLVYLYNTKQDKLLSKIYKMNYYHLNKQISQSALYAFLASVTVVSLLLGTFLLFEPQVGRSATFVEDSNEFYIRQTITDETSFLVQPSNVAMVGSISGVTGGQATGTTDFSVISNNDNGYYVQIRFEDTGEPLSAMKGDNTGSFAIRNYSAGNASPTYNFTASTAAQFAYTVTSDDDADTAQAFLDNGSACNQFGGTDGGSCWKAPSTTAYTIVNRTSSANTGATSTLTFSVVVPSSATPAVTADTYTATATLSLYTQ